MDLQSELAGLGARIVRPLALIDYYNNEFVFEDIDGRWIAVGSKVKLSAPPCTDK